MLNTGRMGHWNTKIWGKKSSINNLFFSVFQCYILPLFRGVPGVNAACQKIP